MLIYKQWKSNDFNTDLLDISLQIINVPWCDILSENDRALFETEYSIRIHSPYDKKLLQNLLIHYWKVYKHIGY